MSIPNLIPEDGSARMKNAAVGHQLNSELVDALSFISMRTSPVVGT
jgi:hypothetical protein